ncbi:urease accessory protein UreD [Rubellimicrobium roseum]|uniref:Urease accessory protein UreD n=1 Tax=Rubellimicrobium roseum TaxID=687525 RepID=A0A5C4N6A0_9RHOB|nr:urease accessory protein UreD [Rubellimicrobium roseum]TNC65978.1 urease accessory protein UreD [Rubellimicrobium roseum]
MSQPPRARGEVVVSAKVAGGVTRLGDLRQQGSLKALFPRGAGPALDVVTLNTAGGLTSGDAMRLTATARAGAQMRLTTQAAERAYRAAGDPPARVESRLVAEDGARIDWLPQETILFDGARLERKLVMDLAPTATALLVEPLLFGRLARGEQVREGRLLDRWEVRRDGRLVFADALRLGGDMAATLDRPGVGGGARAVASVLFAGAAAEAHLDAARALLAGSGGASLIAEGVLFARLMAPDGYALRAALVPLICRLTGAALPKVWTL